MLTMDKKRSISISLFVLLAFTTSASLANDTEKKVELTQKQLESVTKQINLLQKELGKDLSFQQKEHNALKKTEKELSSLYQQARTLKQQQSDIKKKITLLEAEQKILHEKNQQQQAALHQDLQAIYKIGRQEKIKLLLNQENPEELARLLKYYDYYSEARVNRIMAFQDNIKAIEAQKITIAQELASLDAVEKNISIQAKTLEKGQQERQVALDTLNAQIKSKDTELKNLQAEQVHLDKLLLSLRGIWADIPSRLNNTSFRKNKGKLPYPVQGRVKNSFGSNRVGGHMQWNGWLISAPLNEDVRSIYDGRVVFSDWIRGYGLVIIVDHSEGFLSLYGHNASLLKEAGEWIRAGEVLATTGNSGGQYESGLYFELRHDGQPVNPRGWLEK